jgi:hypothetical protein
MTMRIPISATAGCLGLGLLAMASASAAAAPAHDGEPQGRAPTGTELIAFEAPGCRYCPIFRRDVAPSYPATRAGKAAPLRFIDVNDESAAAALTLMRPVTMVPTVVLVRDGVEIGRIDGYVGRENMLHILNTLLPPD